MIAIKLSKSFGRGLRAGALRMALAEGHQLVGLEARPGDGAAVVLVEGQAGERAHRLLPPRSAPGPQPCGGSAGGLPPRVPPPTSPADVVHCPVGPPDRKYFCREIMLGGGHFGSLWGGCISTNNVLTYQPPMC